MLYMHGLGLEMAICIATDFHLYSRLRIWLREMENTAHCSIYRSSIAHIMSTIIPLSTAQRKLRSLFRPSKGPLPILRALSLRDPHFYVRHRR